MSDHGNRIEDCTGVLVAGGRAARLGGIPKGLLRLGGEPIASRTLRLFGELFATSLVVAHSPGEAGEGGWGGEGAGERKPVVVTDHIPGKGAPGGVHAGLAAAPTGWIFAAACDMPFLEPSPIRLLAARREGVAAVLVRSGGRLHPLHAFWSRACLPALERMLRSGNPSLVDLARAVPSCIVEEDEWRTLDPSNRALENANTPEDAARLGLTYRP